MGIRVKCQHCWKIFEVPDDFVNKQRQCTFCQRMTVATPADSGEKQTTEEQQVAPDFQTYKHLGILVGILLCLTILNICFMLFSGKSDDGFREAITQEIPEWRPRLQQQLQDLEKLLSTCQIQLQKNSESASSPENTAMALIGGMEGSIKLITAEITKRQQQLDNIKTSLKKLQAELDTLAKKNK